MHQHTNILLKSMVLIIVYKLVSFDPVTSKITMLVTFAMILQKLKYQAKYIADCTVPILTKFWSW